MPTATPLHFLLLTFAGWVNRQQQDVVAYLSEENRVLREQLDRELVGRRMRFTDEQRRRLAAKGKLLGRKLLQEYAGLVTPDTILRWHRRLIAQKYDGSARRGPGRSRKPAETAVEVLTLGGLVRYSVLFVIELSTRRVPIAGTTSGPEEEWMRSMARHLTDGFDGFLLGKHYLILDRDPLFTRRFCDLLRSAGVEPLRIPARSPNLNAYAERFVLSIKSECLNRIAILGERHLRYAIREYVEHYHLERHHQGLEHSILTPEESRTVDGPIRRRQRLGGLLSYYDREAA